MFCFQDRLLSVRSSDSEWEGASALLFRRGMGSSPFAGGAGASAPLTERGGGGSARDACRYPRGKGPLVKSPFLWGGGGEKTLGGGKKNV